MKLEKRFKKIFVTLVISLVFVSLTTSSIVYAGKNTLLGDNASRNLTSSANYNTFMGYSSGQITDTGENNSFFGAHA